MPLFFNKSQLLSGKQAQQSYRFVLNVRGVDAALIKKVTVPKYKVTTTSYSLLEYTFKYPNKIEWQGPIEFEVLQIIDGGAITTTLGYFMSKLYDSAYYASPMGVGTGERDTVLPNALYNARSNISSLVNNREDAGYIRRSGEGTVFDFSKQKLQAALGIVEIKTLDEEGRVYESWRLNGAFITGLSSTDLSYDSESLATVKVELSYDWADYGFRGVYAEEDAVSRVLGI